MQTPSWFERNKAVITTIAIFGITQLCTVVYMTSETRTTLAVMQARATERSGEIDQKFAKIDDWQRQSEQLNLGYRMGLVEQQLDRLNQSIVSSLDRVNGALNSVDKRIDLLTQRVETALPPRRAGLMFRDAKYAGLVVHVFRPN